MRKPENRDDDFETPSQLIALLGLSVAISLGVILAVFVLLNSLGPAHQAFWSGLAGSFVGSLVAFILAALLWRIERKVLVGERKKDREEFRREEQRRGDVAALRSLLGLVVQIQSMRYGLATDTAQLTGRERYMLELRVQETVSLIKEYQLQEETQFLASLLSQNSGLDQFVMPSHLRFEMTKSWLSRLIDLDPLRDPASVRPEHYEAIRKGINEYERVVREYWDEANEDQPREPGATR
ncbi:MULTISPECIES: hypothetical protein [unclassified Arthrobacter]|uniref:hypothetical protein n=1 Tax=unclassified Arthrobacter TaxID=235627 RepID=UPI00288343F1|nr:MULTISPECIES: hypothetical protein [unclassified Arthrobacter]